MAESFLEAQLQRIRELSERMSQVQSYAEEARRDRVGDAYENPLYGARDYRMVSFLDEEPALTTAARTEHTEPSRRRRRRRRR